MRTHRLWRPDNRYPGTMSVHRNPESGGAELSFDALRHGAKPRPPIVVDSADVDKLILSLLEVRNGAWEEGAELRPPCEYCGNPISRAAQLSMIDGMHEACHAAYETEMASLDEYAQDEL